MEQGQTHVIELVKELGMFALKSLLTLNAGACLALLAFLANVLSADKSSAHIDLATLRMSLGWFLAGIGFVFLEIAISYLVAQLSSVGRALTQNLWCFLSLMILPPLLSFVAFACGAWQAMTAVSW